MEKLISDQFDLIKNSKIGLLAHAASVDQAGTHILDLLAKLNLKVTTLFGPEHGISTKAQDMEPVASSADVTTHIPIYSLYGETFESLSPTVEMLDDIDVLLVDLQDIGSRYYTYVWTMALAMKACAKSGKKVIVCDRPNPLGGITVEGTLQKEGFESFVGLYPIAVRHAMTIGEISNYINDTYSLECDLKVISMEGWQRETLWPDTKIKWTNPSPNMRSFNAALLYPGICLLEGTNISEGRGTDTPFDIIGAPYIDSEEVIEEFSKLGLPGIRLAPTSFIPAFQKHMGMLCNGVRFVVENVNSFKPFLTGLGIIWTINKLYKNSGFKWRTEKYEFVEDIPAIDLLTGSDEFRKNIDDKFERFYSLSEVSKDFLKAREGCLLYKQGTVKHG